ncbi:MAG: MFS transporter [Candidatus Eremiobacteraeota bacterium]|nr:MFS transporter [Candidatus Eremiobacteraeota bacterium]
MSSTLITPLYALYRSEFRFSEITLTLVYAIYVVGNLGAVLFCGRLSDSVGRRRVALPAIALAAASSLLFIFAQGTAWLYVARLLSGFSVGLASGTGTAWLADTFGAGARDRATLAATSANLSGAALGPLLSGLLAEYAPQPLQLSFYAYLIVLAVTAVVVLRGREIVEPSPGARQNLSIAPQIGVPKDIRAAFLPPAVTAAGAFALAGFYFALLPGVLSRDLGEKNLAVAGSVVFEMLAISLVVTVVSSGLRSGNSMVAGLALQIPSVAMLVLAQGFKSMPLLLLGAAVTGTALGLGYRGSLQVVNELAPNDKRAAVVSAYFAAIFIGNSIPIIGISVLTSLSGALTANVAFACTIGAFAIAALLARARFAPA